jgi:polysaccharide pyruvyl transferase WcaK-like protein
MLQRIANAARFYQAETKREAAKHVAALHARRSGKPAFSYMGWVGHNNLGDEILYDAHKVLFADQHVVPFTKRSAARYSAGILGGGTLINQSSSWLHQIAHLQRKGLPIFCIGTGVTQTDFKAPHEQTTMRQWVDALNTFDFVGVRGPYSLAALKEAGFSKAVITGDTALSLAPDTYRQRTGVKVIGFNYGLVKENQIWGDANTYTDHIVSTIKRLLSQGYEIKLLPVWDKDIASNKALLEKINDPRCTMKLCFDSLDAYNAELAACDLFIGQKLHATIMACMQRIPSIMIEYQPKCRDFMASVAMEEYVIKTSDCTPEVLLSLVKRLRLNTTNVQQILDTHVLGYKNTQRKAAQKLAKQYR